MGSSGRKSNTRSHDTAIIFRNWYSGGPGPLELLSQTNPGRSRAGPPHYLALVLINGLHQSSIGFNTRSVWDQAMGEKGPKYHQLPVGDSTSHAALCHVTQRRTRRDRGLFSFSSFSRPCTLSAVSSVSSDSGASVLQVPWPYWASVLLQRGSTTCIILPVFCISSFRMLHFEFQTLPHTHPLQSILSGILR